MKHLPTRLLRRSTGLDVGLSFFVDNSPFPYSHRFAGTGLESTTVVCLFPPDPDQRTVGAEGKTESARGKSRKDGNTLQ